MEKLLHYYINTAIQNEVTPYLSDNRHSMWGISVVSTDGYHTNSNMYCVFGKTEVMKKAHEITQQLNRQILIKLYVTDTAEIWELENNGRICLWVIK